MRHNALGSTSSLVHSTIPPAFATDITAGPAGRRALPNPSEELI
ncbi:hypothetical protein [Nesterenkonia haasae]|nr:hypothetical protein [Nesterenkonia haasae]